MLKLTIEILPGELADRISILELRIQHLQDGSQRTLAGDELNNLQIQWESLSPLDAEVRALIDRLAKINRRLWEVEDQLRLHESRKDFGANFIELARSVYKLNDERSVLKREINLNLCGLPGEQKVHIK